MAECDLPVAGTHCSVCNNACIFETLRCQKCKNFFHTDCTKLPVYAIVNFFNTRSQYTCEGCVKEFGDKPFALVYDLLEKEKEFKLKKNEEITSRSTFINDQQSSHSSELGSERHHSLSDTQQQVSSGEKVETAKKTKKICFHYRQNRCKYGVGGRNCPFYHPKLCNRYKAFGLDSVKGCKEGKDCQYLHPAICFASERRRECFNLQCNKLHLKGTRRYPGNEQRTERAAEKKTPMAHHYNTEAPNPGTIRAPINAPCSNLDSSQADSLKATVNFLVQQIQLMQQVQQQIVQQLKTPPWQYSVQTQQWPQQQASHPLIGHIR